MPIWRIEIIGQFGDGTPSHFGEFLFGAINMENLSEFLKERDLKLFLSWGVNKKVEKRGAKSWMHFLPSYLWQQASLHAHIIDLSLFLFQFAEIESST